MIHTCRGLEVACRIVAFRKEDVVINTAFKRLVQRDGLSHELLLDFAQTVEAGLKLEVVIAIVLSNGRNDCDVVALGADVVGRRYNGDVDI